MIADTPLVEEFFQGLNHDAARNIARLDAAQDAPVRSVGYRLRAWETSSARLGAVESPDNSYLADEYINDLDIRDALQRIRDALPAASRMPFDALLAALDRRFEAVTEDDGGQALSWLVSRAETAHRSWWWRRRPRILPWQQ